MITRLCIIGYRALQLVWFWVRKRHTEDFHQKFAERIRRICEHLGPTFIKLGQILSMRPDYLPDVYCAELEQLLDNAPRIPMRVIREQIEHELKAPMIKTFQSFDRTPIASASISQVHRAVLWNDDVVGVKVLRPGVEKLIKQDMRCLRLMVSIFGNCIGRIRKQYWQGVIEQVQQWLVSETDYLHEVENIKIMQKELCDGATDIIVPSAYEEFSTRRVLVMEFMNGWTLNELVAMKRKGTLPAFTFDLEERLRYLGDRMFITSLCRGYVHGDIHPANLFITKEGHIGFVDFGLIQYFDVKLRHNFILLLIGSAFASPELVTKAARKTGKIPEGFDEETFYRSISKICAQYKDAPASEMSNSEFLVLCIHECLRHGIEIPWPVIIYARSTTGMDGIILKLYPEYIMMKHTRPLFLKIFISNLAKELMSISKAVSVIDDLVSVAKDVPQNLRTFIDAFVKKQKEYAGAA